jgi:hypothetical protein
MGWMESSSSNHSCDCRKKDDHKHHDWGCRKKDDHKHHDCDCYNWHKYQDDNDWRRRCRNRLERVQIVSTSTNNGPVNGSVNGLGNGIDNDCHKKRKKKMEE